MTSETFKIEHVIAPPSKENPLTFWQRVRHNWPQMLLTLSYGPIGVIALWEEEKILREASKVKAKQPDKLIQITRK